MATTTTPAIAIIATTAEIATHTTAVQSANDAIVASLKAGTALTEDVAQKFIDNEASLVNQWIDKKHSNTRLLEVAAGVAVLFFIFGALAGSFLRL